MGVMPREGRTGLVVLVPQAEGVLADVAQHFPEAVRNGTPAHISLLYPFLPADSCNDVVLTALSEIVAQTEPLTVRLSECERRDDFTALRPEPLEPLRALSERAQQRWPHLAPYEGRFGHVDPHVTVALRTTAERARIVEQEIVPPHLPITAELRDVRLVAFDGGHWTVRHEFQLGAG